MQAEHLRWGACRLAPLLTLAVLGGCAGLFPRLKAPHVSVVSVQVRSADFWRQRLQVRLQVRNPNGIDLSIESIRYTLQVNGSTFADGRTAEGFTVPAHGSAEFDTEVTANMAGAVFAVLSQGRGRPVHYRLRGEVELAHELLRSLPFDERGSFTLK